MDLCRQSNVSAFEYTVYVCHYFSSKEKMSFDFRAAVTICSDFGAQENKVSDSINRHSRIDAFELRCWRRLLRVPWIARRSNQSILKEISPEYSLEGLMLKLKLQYFGHLMRRTESLEKTLMLGKIKGRRIKGQQRMRGSMASLTQWT